MAANRGKHVRDIDPELFEKMSKGLEALADTYRQAGAHVIQNTLPPPAEVINYTSGWLGQYGKHWAFHAQAFGETFGNVIVNFHETQPSIRYNCVEYVEAFMGLVENDPNAVWLAMPDPLPLPTAFGAALSPGDIRIFPNKLVVVGHGVFDKAHIQDTSRPRSSGNELGAEVLIAGCTLVGSVLTHTRPDPRRGSLGALEYFYLLVRKTDVSKWTCFAN